MKTLAAYVFVVIWLYHLTTGVAAWAAIYRIWPERHNQFVKFTMIHLHAAVFDALGAVVCLFLAKGVTFTWKFSIALFTFMLVRDLVRLPLILFIFRGPRKEEAGRHSMTAPTAPMSALPVRSNPTRQREEVN